MLKELLYDNDVILDQIQKYSQDYDVYHKKRRLREIKKLKWKKKEKYLINDLKQRQINLRVKAKSKTYMDFSRHFFLNRCIQSRKEKRRIKTKLNSPSVIFSFRNQEEEKLDEIRREFQGDKLKLNNDDMNVKIKLFNAQGIKEQRNSFSKMRSTTTNKYKLSLTNSSKEEESEKNNSYHLSSDESADESNYMRIHSGPQQRQLPK